MAFGSPRRLRILTCERRKIYVSTMRNLMVNNILSFMTNGCNLKTVEASIVQQEKVIMEDEIKS